MGRRSVRPPMTLRIVNVHVEPEMLNLRFRRARTLTQETQAEETDTDPLCKTPPSRISRGYTSPKVEALSAPSMVAAGTPPAGQPDPPSPEADTLVQDTLRMPSADREDGQDGRGLWWTELAPERDGASELAQPAPPARRQGNNEASGEQVHRQGNNEGEHAGDAIAATRAELQRLKAEEHERKVKVREACCPLATTRAMYSYINACCFFLRVFTSGQ